MLIFIVTYRFGNIVPNKVTLNKCSMIKKDFFLSPHYYCVYGPITFLYNTTIKLFTFKRKVLGIESYINLILRTLLPNVTLSSYLLISYSLYLFSLLAIF